MKFYWYVGFVSDCYRPVYIEERIKDLHLTNRLTDIYNHDTSDHLSCRHTGRRDYYTSAATAAPIWHSDLYILLLITPRHSSSLLIVSSRYQAADDDSAYTSQIISKQSQLVISPILLTTINSTQVLPITRCRICSICWPAAAKYTRTDEDLVTTLRHISLASYLRFKAEQTFRDTNWDSSYLITFGALSRGCDILIERNGNLYP